jgi:hypothetical protein
MYLEKVFLIIGGTNRLPFLTTLPSSEISTIPDGQWAEDLNLLQGHGISNHCLVRMADGKVSGFYISDLISQILENRYLF